MLFSIISKLFSLLLNRQKLENSQEFKDCLNTKLEKGKHFATGLCWTISPKLQKYTNIMWHIAVPV